METLEWADDQSEWSLPAISDDDVIAWETKFGVKLPRQLKDLYRIQNGGCIQPGSRQGIDRIAGITSDEGDILGLFPARSIQSLIDEVYDGECKDFRSDCTKVFCFDGDGHYYYAFDFTFNDDPEIIYIGIESGLSRTVKYKNFNDFYHGNMFKVKTVDLSRDRNFQGLVNNARRFHISVKSDPVTLVNLITCNYYFEDDEFNQNLLFYLMRRIDSNCCIKRLGSIEASLWVDVFNDLGLEYNFIDSSISDLIYSWRHLLTGYFDDFDELIMVGLISNHYCEMYFREHKRFLFVVANKSLRIADIRALIKPDDSPIDNGDLYAHISNNYPLIDNDEIRYIR